ncbi:MAG: hypothetical protein KDA96_23160, partial [Planctomycetaceae bacterium]|nr:hypothetical protein [Planctomycetaceae bacterium]
SPAGLQAAMQFTTDFYELASRRLSGDGIFCQRFRQHDFGAWPLTMVLSTMGEVFEHVAAIQSVPGEMVLLASNREGGLFQEGFLERLQLDHVRREIDATGWDWVQVAVLPVIDVNDRLGLFSHQERTPALTSSNAKFAMGVQFDVYRKTDKAAEVQADLQPHAVRLANTVRGTRIQEEIQRREAAMVQQLEILAGLPDRQWVYRRSLRSEMQRRPRAPVDVVENGQVVRRRNPLDEVRIQYFQTLGHAIQCTQQQVDTAEAIQELEPFTRATEPLLSYFAHLEMVRLYEQADHPAPRDEFEHRVHSVFYTIQADSSVKPVIAAIEQLVKQPELLSVDSDRYDLMNGMLQKLVERWKARVGMEPRSVRETQRDVERSILAANDALECLDRWAENVGIHRDARVQRRKYLVTELITPLRQYSDQVLAHRIRSQQQDPDPEDDGAADDLPLLLPQEMLDTN